MAYEQGDMAEQAACADGPAPAMTVVVPVHNDAENLRACLQAIANSDGPCVEIVVVDDASTDTSAAVAEAMGARVVSLQHNAGPAAARNRGAEAARNPVIFFIDADVCVRRDTLTNMAAVFADETVAACFGSYDDAPTHRGFISQYRNLFHHHVHQHASAQACTFWSGCGAIRGEIFLAMGGFDASYSRPCIEDIELGVRLHKAGYNIRLARHVQVTHRKRWTLTNMVRTDVRDRGIPWTRLILREKHLPADLNLGITQRLSALAAGVLIVMLGGMAVWQPMVLLLPGLAMAGVLVADAVSTRGWATRTMGLTWFGVIAVGMAMTLWMLPTWAAVVLLPVATIVALNLKFYRFFIASRGLVFTAGVLPMHVLYYLYSGFAFAVAVLLHIRGNLRGGGQQGQGVATVVATREGER